MKVVKEHIGSILKIFVVSLILLVPFFVNDYMKNDDTWFHLMNIGLIVEQMKTNFFSLFTLRIYPFIAHGFGYGTRLFYPPLAHFLGAIIGYVFSFFSIGLKEALKTFHFLELFLSGITMYLCAYRFHKNKKVAFFASLIYMASSYHICEIYVRDALGESLIFIFLPLIILGVKELLEGNKKWFYSCFIIGYVGGILAHFTMMIYITLILGISLLFYYKKVFRKDFLLPFSVATILVLLLCAFFFEPMLEHKFLGNYMVYKKWVMSLGIWHTTLWGIEYLWDVSFTSLNSSISFRFSFFTLFLLGMVIWQERKNLWNQKWKLISIFGILSFLMTTRAFFPWLWFPYMLFMIQFGWRLVSLVIFVVALLSAKGVEKISSNIVLIILSIGIIISGLIIPNNQREKLNLETIDEQASLGWMNEYFPVAMVYEEEDFKYYQNRNHDLVLLEGEATYQIVEDSVPDLKFVFQSTNPVKVELPIIYYLGYELTKEDGTKIPLRESEHGFIECTIEKGEYELHYVGTLGYHLASCVSLGTFLAILGFLGYRRIRRKK